MKKILIYGDSNTWGDDFTTGIRLEDKLQWPNLLQKKLGKNYKIIEEGLPGRLAGNEELIKTYKNGKSTFMSIFRTCSPVDIVIIALGTNDLQVKYNKNSDDIINDLLWYKDNILEQFNNINDRLKYFNNKLPRIIYVLPPKFDLKKCDGLFNEKSERERLSLSKIKDIIDDVIVLDYLPLVNDGIHLSIEGHKLMSEIIGKFLENE